MDKELSKHDDLSYIGLRWFMPVSPALGREKQEDKKFKVILGHIAIQG